VFIEVIEKLNQIAILHGNEHKHICHAGIWDSLKNWRRDLLKCFSYTFYGVCFLNACL